jgi:hypothetical protein
LSKVTEELIEIWNFSIYFSIIDIQIRIEITYDMLQYRGIKCYLVSPYSSHFRVSV